MPSNMDVSNYIDDGECGLVETTQQSRLDSELTPARKVFCHKLLALTDVPMFPSIQTHDPVSSPSTA